MLPSLSVCPRSLRAPAPLLALAALLALSAPAAAQGPGNVLRGRVVDASTGQPLAGARLDVERLDRRAYADAEGAFRIDSVPDGLFGVRVRHIGYQEQRADLVSAAGQEPATISLSPDPVLLEGFQVQVDRFERRRRALPYSVRTIGRNEWTTRVGLSARDAILRSAGLTGCGGSDRGCVLVRGRRSTVDVFVDERPASGGLAELDLYAPQDLYMVEIHRGGAHIRVYTVEFMERTARTRMIPEPIRL